ncbi:MAG: phospholipid carrier-dependent glycosyltransferase [Gammaproteobacteria bacterium]|nr:phospholipid carrier-dependent glycosyltransferase [Gammaproteobacteria bacterium]
MGKFNRLLVASNFLGAITSIAILGFLFDSGHLENDFAQMYSVASNVALGNGFQTSLIFYDSHYAFGGSPVPQTVFPPGYAAMVAPFLVLGFPGYATILVFTLGAFVGSGVLVACIGRLLGCRDALCIVLSSVWYFIGANWANVLILRSEVFFCFFTTAALYCLVRWSAGSGRLSLWLSLVGVFAGVAFLFRYQGIFFIAAVGLVFALRALQLRTRVALRDMAVVCSIPTAVFVWTILYNWQIAGGVGGGPIDQVQHSAPLALVALGFYYEFSRILGVSQDGLASGGASELFMLALLCWLMYAAAQKRFWKAVWGGTFDSVPAATCVAYGMLSVAALVYLSAAKSTGFMQARYLSVLAPFVLVWILGVAPRQQGTKRSGRSVGGLGLFFLVGFLVFGQARAIGDQLADWRSDDRLARIRSALNDTIQGVAIRTLLRSEIDAGHHVMAFQSQLLGHDLERTTFGFTPSLYTSRIFDFDEVERLARQYRIRYLVHFPQLYDQNTVENRNRVALTRLQNGQKPGWLSLLVDRREIQVYEVHVDRQGSPVTPGNDVLNDHARSQ